MAGVGAAMERLHGSNLIYNSGGETELFGVILKIKQNW